jgi:hypothetical protein
MFPTRRVVGAKRRLDVGFNPRNLGETNELTNEPLSKIGERGIEGDWRSISKRRM